jgi:hypothetical protein
MYVPYVELLTCKVSRVSRLSKAAKACFAMYGVNQFGQDRVTFRYLSTSNGISSCQRLLHSGSFVVQRLRNSNQNLSEETFDEMIYSACSRENKLHELLLGFEFIR